MCRTAKLHRLTHFLPLDLSHSSHVHPGRSWRQRQMLLLRWRAEELGAGWRPLAGARQMVSKVGIHHLPVFKLSQVSCFSRLYNCILYDSQMWVFNPVERAGVYQQHTGCSFPSGWDCGESLYPSYLLRIKSVWHAGRMISSLRLKWFTTFTVNSKYDFFSRVYHRPPQAEISDPEMVSHIKTKQGRECWVCTKNFKKNVIPTEQACINKIATVLWCQ